MYRQSIFLLFMAGLWAFWSGCNAQPNVMPGMDPERFSAYWYQGKAEISSYALTQARYGRQHDGTAVMIFVTEDLSRKKQVKLDDPAGRRADPVKVIKLNQTRSFVTGIYEYHAMTSVFTPVDAAEEPHTLKVTTGVQDWCGQTFLQANWKGNRYDLTGFSYFESEGDAQIRLKAAWLEDELWNRIRIDPSSLPEGKIEIVPAFLHARFAHEASGLQPAEASHIQTDSTTTYIVAYSDIPRKLEITYERAFPHRILSWREIVDQEVTEAVLINTLVTPYWTQNRPEDEPLRERLRLPK
jgi:hypothetical protein